MSYYRGDLITDFISAVPGATGLLEPFSIENFGKGGLVQPASMGPSSASMAAHAAGANVLGGRKRRRMNVLNPRALRRSYRRVIGASKWARRVFTFARSGHHGVKMKARRRSSR